MSREPVLTKGEKRRALSGKKTKKCVRNTLVNPYVISWPTIDETAEKELHELVLQSLTKLRRPRLKIQLASIRSIAKNERRDYRRRQREQLLQESGVDNFAELRSSLVMGVNHLARSLEKGEVVSALVARDVDPPMLTKFLVPLATTRSVPMLAIAGMAETTDKCLGFRCIALGFKSAVANTEHEFHNLHQKITSLSSEIKTVPWDGFPISEEAEAPVDPDDPAAAEEEEPHCSGFEIAVVSEAPSSPEKEEAVEVTVLSRTSESFRVFVPQRKEQPAKPPPSTTSLPGPSAMPPPVAVQQMPSTAHLHPMHHLPPHIALPPLYPYQMYTPPPHPHMHFAHHSPYPLMIPPPLTCPPQLQQPQIQPQPSPSSSYVTQPIAVEEVPVPQQSTVTKKCKRKRKRKSGDYKPMKIKKVQSNPNKGVS